MDHLNNNHFKVNTTASTLVSSGGGAWPLYKDHVENFAWANNVFSESELDAICNIGKSINLEKAGTFGLNSDSIRNSYVSFLFPNEYTTWIFEKLSEIINDVNSKYFKFDISSMEQGIQFTQYTAPDGHYNWHIDKAPEAGIRKLSVSLQLSNPDDYEGGDLELWFGGKEPIKIEKTRGFMTFFPSYAMHRVAPVTKGTRKSLVCWISGPPFK